MSQTPILESETKQDEKGWLFYSNRLGFMTLAFAGIAADVVNTLGLSDRKGLWLGELTNHVGDTVHGFNALSLGFLVWKALEIGGMDKRLARTICLVVTGAVLTFVVTAEMTGFMNKPDILDLPAIGIGLIGCASMWELPSEDAQNALNLKKTTQ